MTAEALSRIANRVTDAQMLAMAAKLKLAYGKSTVSATSVVRTAAAAEKVKQLIDDLLALLEKNGAHDPVWAMMVAAETLEAVRYMNRTIMGGASDAEPWASRDLVLRHFAWGDPPAEALIAYALQADASDPEMLPEYARNLHRADPDAFRSFCAMIASAIYAGSDEISCQFHYGGSKDPKAWADAWVLTARAIAAPTHKKPAGKAKNGGKTIELTIPLPKMPDGKPEPCTTDDIAAALQAINERLGIQMDAGVIPTQPEENSE